MKASKTLTFSRGPKGCHDFEGDKTMQTYGNFNHFPQEKVPESTRTHPKQYSQS